MDYNKSIISGQQIREMINEVNAIYKMPIDGRTKGAYITALKKRVKRDVFKLYVDSIPRTKYDLTTTLVKKLSVRALGRGVDNAFLIANYATENRKADDKTKDIKKVDEIYKKYLLKEEENYGIYEDFKRIDGLFNTCKSFEKFKAA